MSRIACLMILGGALSAIQPAHAQRPFDKGGPKKFEAEIEKLRHQVRELESLVKKLQAAEDTKREPAKKKEGKHPPFEKKDFPKKFEGKGPWGDGPPWAKKDGKKGPWRMPPFGMKNGKGPSWAGPPWGRPGFGRGMDRSRDVDLERRLERIQRDLEDLRRDVQRK